jgi:hypothetical protein
MKSARSGEYDFMRLVARLCVQYLYAEVGNTLRKKATQWKARIPRRHEERA